MVIPHESASQAIGSQRIDDDRRLFHLVCLVDVVRMGEFSVTVEEHRHQCEVRHVLRRRVSDKSGVDEYLELVGKKRGEAAMMKLKTDCAMQWGLGNRGDKGVWL